MKIGNTMKFDHCSLQKSTYAGGLSMEPHFDKDCKISIIMEGVLLEKYSQTHIQAGKGSLVIKPNNAKHENIFISKQTTVLSLSFAKDYMLSPILKKYRWLEHPKISFLAIRLLFSLKSVKNDLQLNNHLTEFVNAVEEINTHQDKSIPGWLKKMKNNFDDVEYPLNNINKLSKESNLHRGYISRTFKRNYSLPPVVYKNYVRLNNLIYSFSEHDKSLAEIAYECGFSDQSHMSRIIKKEMGITAKNLRILAQSI